MGTDQQGLKADVHYPRDAAETRARILQAARLHFSQRSFEQVGVRDIARDAKVDAAMINRYFGSKEKLFIEVIRGSFRTEDLLRGDVDEVGARFAGHILAKMDDGDSYRDELDPLLLLLRSAPDPKAASIVAQAFQAEFVGPLAEKLQGENADVRAGLIAAYIIGLATMRVVLHSPVLDDEDAAKISALFQKALLTCIDETRP